MYVCLCIIYEIDERYPLDATINLFYNVTECFGLNFIYNNK